MRRSASSITAPKPPVIAVGGVARPQRIVLPEPPRRTPHPLPPAASFHALISKDVHRPSGRRVAGPAMLRPIDIGGVMAAGRAQGKQRSVLRAESPQLTPRAVPGRTHGVPVPPKSQTRTTQSVQTISGTGINHWWRYQEENIPGGGRVMVNLGTGNVLIQDDDMVIPHKGMSLTFRRTYNSQSLHTVAGGSAEDNGNNSTGAGMYGNGWTNTFDAHMVKLSPSIRSVYDIDGARYDYVMPSNPTWTSGMILHPATPGDHAYVQYDGSCGWYWIKKSGTIYYFYLTDPGNGCPVMGTLGAYSGRLYQIVGRNYNNYLTFSYAWDNGDASAATGKVSTITVQSESGMTATLNFVDIAGHRLLGGIWFPDGTTYVSYGYDAQGNLNNVSRPPNNAGGERPSHSYGYVQQGGGGSIIAWADSPRWAKSPGDGDVTNFAFTGSSPQTATLDQMSRIANVNPSVPDGTNSAPLQPGYPTGAYEYYDEYFATGGSTATFRDTDGHALNWILDAQGRVTQTQECSATVNQACNPNAPILTTNESWDADNNLVSRTDARGNVTDYAYDVDGNTVAVAEPAPDGGGSRPTSLYTYGAYDNLVAYCDPNETHRLQAEWTSRPLSPIPVGAGSCPAQGSSNWRATYSYPWYEPFGELASMTTPSGCTRTFSYAPGQQAGNDFGLPTAVTGDPIAQLDGTTRTPAQTFWYDATGNLRCYSKGNGTTVLSYDALSRLVSVADPDDASANGGSLCGKSSGVAGWNTQTTYAYYPDGSKQSAQSPSERAFGVSTSYAYDVDGNVIAETAHHGCVPNQVCNAGTTQKWYDGVDRLVQVQQPWDSRTYSWPNTPGMTLPYDGGRWMMRYFYDLSAGHTVTVDGSAPFSAYGNLYKTQKGAGSTFLDLSGSAFDALDRETTKFSWLVAFDPAANSQLELTQLQYDGGTPAAAGLLTKKTNPAGESVSYAYDERGHIVSQTYAGDNGVTPSETTTYDADGHVTSVTSSRFGTQQYRYDDDGRLSSTTEPSGGGLTGAAQIAYRTTATANAPRSRSARPASRSPTR